MRLIDCLGETEELSHAFSDATVLAAMLEFEAGLARAQARVGIIRSDAADVIWRTASSPLDLDLTALGRDARHNATIAIPFVKALTARVQAIDATAAGYVHYGATSQDLTDTALVLLLRRAHTILARGQKKLGGGLRRLSTDHASTIMLARTLLQPAPPITFGYKAAGWLGGIGRSWRELDRSFGQALQLQFGGASGTLASFGKQGPALAAELGRELQLPVPPAPWHAHRDRLAAVVTGCGVYSAGLGKIARDITLLMQYEVAEAFEPGGGSSAMPHKRNPAASCVALAAAMRIPGLVAGYLTSMIQEHERGAGGVQSEWQTIAAVIEATGSALSAVSRAIEGLSVDPARMRANIDSTRGAIFSERAAMLLAESHGRSEAQALVAQALATGLPLQEGLRALLTAEQIEAIADPDTAAGSSEFFRRRLLEEEESSE